MSTRFRTEILTIALGQHTGKDDLLASVLTTLGEAHEVDRGDARLHRATGQVSIRVTYRAADLTEAQQVAQQAAQGLPIAADVITVRSAR